jgi:DNA ligase 1
MLVSRPMLAGRLKTQELRFPCLATPKLDGIRALKLGGTMYSRSFKPIRNMHIVSLLESSLPDGVDGELMSGHFNDAQSNIMKYDGTPEFVYHVFDLISEQGYEQRILSLQAAVQNSSNVQLVLPTLIANQDDFDAYYQKCLDEGYEGCMTRTPDSPYKMGRSTQREQWLLKHKPCETSEAEIIGFHEALQNDNPQVPNAFGLMKRPGGRSGKTPKGTLGAFEVVDVTSKIQFQIGTGKGLTQSLRQHIWDNQAEYIGKIITYEYQPYGMKDKPRFTSFIGFRHPDDM